VIRDHRLAEARSLALHRAVAERLAREPEFVAVAARRVEGWLAAGTPHPRYAQRWKEILALPREELLQAITDPGEEATALRQVSPFAGFLTPQERWRVWRSVRVEAP
jgi:hypothetical protein